MAGLLTLTALTGCGLDQNVTIYEDGTSNISNQILLTDSEYKELDDTYRSKGITLDAVFKRFKNIWSI